MLYIYLVLIAYLLGSIPFGLILAKFAGKGDLRKMGSGNTGATNAMRAGGAKLALPVLVLDMAKSALATYLGWSLTGSIEFGAVCGLVAIIGHCFSIWLKFKGGKGVASFFGTLLVISPSAFLTIGLTWVLIAVITGYSSLGAVISLIAFPIFIFVTKGFYLGVVAVCISALSLWLHRGNIRRLLSGTESKIKWKKSK